MYAVFDTVTNKYLKRFSGSYNNRCRAVHYRIRRQMGLSWYHDTPELNAAVQDAMWTTNKSEAKLYSSKAAVACSFYSKREYDSTTRKYKSMAEALPHLEIVEVEIR